MEIKESLKSFVEYLERNLDTDYCVVGSLALRKISKKAHDFSRWDELL